MEMNELLEPFERMLETISTPAAVRAVEHGGTIGEMWSALVESGFLDALVSEDAGGFGLTLGEVGPLIQALGRHAVPVPVAETMVVRALLAAAGVDRPEGPITLATALGDEIVVPFGLVAEHVLADRGDTLVLVGAGDASPAPTGVRSDLSARMQFGAAAGTKIARPAGGLRPIAAVLRAGLISGAADKLLTMTTQFANDRIQFGKPIGRQQALQQNLAMMAEDVIATRLAAQLACDGGLPVRMALAATAKSVASTSAARIANIAHAVHGAIGISEEYDLQLLTRRLHEWRLADGSEGYWNRVLGGERLATGPALSVDWVRAEVFA
ncbi:MAG: acyl-CoA dehydrogenase [Sphingomonadales bacterium]|nr:acyl-CoA dehydrogenase [Sphingomonadales bacterium]MBU3993503.1 acyl-CoA dehydrogenase [Alphaproteobacteria bacterium]